MVEKPLLWVGSARDDLREFPDDARRRAGFELQQMQLARQRKENAVKKHITPSSGNVFADIGFPAEEAENLKVRAVLMASLRKIVEAEGLTQSQAAEMFGVTQPRVSDLVRGRIELFSIDGLVNMLAAAGRRIEIKVKSDKSRAA